MLNLGTLPENGTICPMEQAIEEAWGFQLEPISSNSGSMSLKLDLGLGLGLGVAGLIALIALAVGFSIFRVRNKKQMKDEQELQDNKGTIFA